MVGTVQPRRLPALRPGCQRTLLIELSGDQACSLRDIETMAKTLGAQDLTRAAVPGTHFGGPVTKGAPSGASLAAVEIGQWLSDRFPAATAPAPP